MPAQHSGSRANQGQASRRAASSRSARRPESQTRAYNGYAQDNASKHSTQAYVRANQRSGSGTHRNARNAGNTRSTSRNAMGTYSDPSRYGQGASRPQRATSRYSQAASSKSDVYSRNAAQTHYASEHRRLARHRIIKRVLIIIAIVVAAAAIAFGAYLFHINSNLNSGVDSGLSNVLVRSNITKEPFYMVLMGTDQSLERDADGSTDDTYRTDSIILARMDPVNKKVTLVSLPRDTEINIPNYGTQKLNAAYAIGGASMAVQAVSDISGQGISHYGLVDMDGLKEVVDDLGGIDVDVPITIDDDDAGGHLDAGEQTLNGDQALILCRSRHAYDQYGAGDDFRAANQRLVLSAIANKILSSDPATIANTVNSLSKYVKTDLSVTDIVALAQAFQGMDTSNDIYSAEMPTQSVYQNNLWYEQIDQSAWKTMMDRVNNGQSPTTENQVDEATGTVLSNAGDDSSGTSQSSSSKAGTIVVRNGSGVTGLASSLSTKLSNAGYSVGNAGNADSFDYTQSIVVYDNANDASEAQDIASIVGGAKAVKNDGNYVYSGDFLVIIGSDYKS